MKGVFSPKPGEEVAAASEFLDVEVLIAVEPEWGSAGRSQHYGYESYA